MEYPGKAIVCQVERSVALLDSRIKDVTMICNICYMNNKV